jgi:hypothetical protein
MSNFKIGDVVKFKYFKNENEYRKIGNDIGWDYKRYKENYEKNKDVLFIVDKIVENEHIKFVKQFYLKPNNITCDFVFEYQIQKVNLRSNKIRKLKLLLN